MGTSIVKLIAAIAGLALTMLGDRVVGKWVAYLTIGWNNAKSANALASFRETIRELRPKMAEGYSTRSEWRKAALERARAEEEKKDAEQMPQA